MIASGRRGKPPCRGRALGSAPSIGIDIETNIGTEMLRFALQLQRGMDNVSVNQAGAEVSKLSISTHQALQ